ncbi:unnamed protein product [Nezara viridula]|uniref:Uncharacterized protein n=1 Tax=Nezara viridula TaxID=85310 RepID=A0A9P0EB55_NEZVI|nr:unnamed protein product [Nezara viridula]
MWRLTMHAGPYKWRGPLETERIFPWSDFDSGTPAKIGNEELTVVQGSDPDHPIWSYLIFAIRSRCLVTGLLISLRITLLHPRFVSHRRPYSPYTAYVRQRWPSIDISFRSRLWFMHVWDV